ncbi:MAG: MFS transporter, partial [Planctomycetes bacterium]|nr:MFS transporter [Planctomycetota bacterium]
MDSGTGETRRPSTQWLLAAHIVAVMLLQSTSVAVMSVLPVLARRRFGASDLQTVLITAAVPAFLALSIFWGALLRRTSLRTYLLIYWMIGLLPLAFVSLAQSYWHVLACHLVGAIGFAAGPPVTSEFLKRLYPDRWRGRAYAAMTAAALVGGVAASYWVGEWLSRDGEAFRIYMPAAALVQLVGIGML